MTLRTLALVLALSLGTAACSAPPPQVVVTPAPAPDAPAIPEGTFTVMGTATLEIEPDTAELHVTVSSTAARPGAASKAARARQARLVEGLAALGVARADLRLSHLSIHPVWNHERQRIDGYQASIRVVASTKDFDRIGAMMDAAADAGATEMSSRFVADLTPHKATVREMAIAAAREKATQLADGLGITLGKVTALGESTGDGRFYYYGESAVPNALDQLPAKLTASTAGELQPLTLTVSVTYRIG